MRSCVLAKDLREGLEVMEQSDSRQWLFIAGTAAAALAAIWLLRSQLCEQPPKATPPPLPKAKVHESLLPSIADALSLIEEPTSQDWQTIKETPALSIYRKNTGDSPVAIIKAHVVVQGVTAADLMTVIWDVEVRVKWDTVLKGFQELEVLSPDSSVIAFYVKPPVPFISARDFVQLRCRQVVDGAMLISYQSVDRPEFPVPEGYIRGHTMISGYRICQVSPSDCEMDFISQTDIKGSIPVGILNTIAPLRAQEWIKKMVAAAQSLGAEKRSS